MLHRTLKYITLVALFGTILNNASTQPIPLWQLQGSTATSPYLNQNVETQGNIVTAKGSGFFFIQTPESQSDNDSETSDAILVDAPYFGSVGDQVSVSGQLQEINGNTTIGGANVSITTTGENFPLPPPVLLNPGFPSPQPAPVHSLEKIENMYVEFTAIANGPSDSQELVPLSTATSRSFREPGIRYPGLSGLPVWDGNPEVFWFDPNGLGAPNNRFISSGTSIIATGVILEAEEDFWLALPNEYTATPPETLTPVRDQTANEFTVACLNAFQLFASASNVDTRLDKLSVYIIQQMKLPDILALQEIGSLAVLQELAYQIELREPGTAYQAYLLTGEDDIHLGYLVKGYIQNVELTQLGKNEVFTFGGLLHDRPPLLLEATLPAVPPVTVRVLNLHMRSLLGIEGSNSSFVRNKRHQQAISVASMVEELRDAGNLIVLGDFNAFQFSDGYVDVVSQITGVPGLGAQLMPVDIVDPPLINAVDLLPAHERYSFVFQGNPQVLDHCLLGELDGLQYAGMEYARGNADYSWAYFSNAFLPQRCSDHDGFVLYLESENPIASSQHTRIEDQLLEVYFPQPARPESRVSIRTHGENRAKRISLYDSAGRLLWQVPLGPHAEQEIAIPGTLPSGKYYMLVVESSHAQYSNWLFLR
jgi:endonuclease/exonuclease/phosphatase family metal-dependent hydrolase